MPTVMLCYRLMCRPLTVIIPFLYSPRCWAFLYVGASVFFIQHMLWIYVTLTWTSADPPHPLTGRHDTALDTLIKPQLRLMDRALNMIRRQQGGMAPPNARLVHARHFSAHCHVYVDPPGGGNLTQGDDSRLFNIAAFTPPPPPFKVYVYDLPDEFNVDRVSCVNRKHYGDGCADLGFCGAGVRLKNETAHLFLHDTWQFSLEVLLHHKMLYSTYRTSNASEASLLYVPYYPGLDCICEEGAGTMGAGRVAARIYRLFKYLRSTGLYPGRNPQGGSPSPHLMGLGKIQREHFTPSCPLLRHPDARNFIFAGIEEEGSSARRAIHRSIGVRPMVVMPYPSYAHLNTFSGTLPKSIASYRRHVFLFLAAGRRRSNPFRAKILNQFADHSTTLSHSESFPETKHYPELLPERDRVWLITDECRGDHKYHTIQWMTHSIFCLQPPGDSPTRKSFYDAVLSGCIPVLFAMPHGRDSSTAATRYPFSETQLRYADFTVTVPFGESDVFRFLHAIPMPHIWEMRKEVLKAAPYLQYSLPIANTPHNDAIKCMLEELQYKHLQL